MAGGLRPAAEAHFVRRPRRHPLEPDPRAALLGAALLLCGACPAGAQVAPRSLHRQLASWPDSIAAASSWNGIHIPRDLREALDTLPSRFPALISRLASEPEDSIYRYHMTVGLWMRNNWGLWAGSRLARYFRTLGIAEPDEMSEIVLVSLWRQVNHRSIQLRAQVACIRKGIAFSDSSRAAAGDTGVYYLADVSCGPTGPVAVSRGAAIHPAQIPAGPP